MVIQPTVAEVNYIGSISYKVYFITITGLIIAVGILLLLAPVRTVRSSLEDEKYSKIII